MKRRWWREGLYLSTESRQLCEFIDGEVRSVNEVCLNLRIIGATCTDVCAGNQ